MKFFSNTFNADGPKNQGITFKEATKFIIPALFIVAIAAILFAQLTMPGHSTLYHVFVGLSITAGLMLYVGGLVISIIAAKKAHDLFRQDDGWRESVTA